MTISFLLAILKTLTSIFYTLPELSTVNIARDRTGSFCQASVHPGIFDGDLQRVVIMASCPSGQKLEIDLGGEHLVHYVMVFEGTGPNPNIGQLNYFAVKVSVLEDVDCGSYPGVSTGSIENKGLRVNCNPSRSFFQYVSIFPSQNIGLKIAEVEVHTFASGRAGKTPILYRGCFSKFRGVSYTMTNGLEGCLSNCIRIDKSFMGIVENSKCRCHDSYQDNTELNENSCNLTCSDGKYFCGGRDSYSVYLISVRLPYYVGCFKKPRIIALQNMNSKDDMIIERCLFTCQRIRYAILMDARTCGCANNVDNIKSYPLTNECNSPCSGNINQTCGGNDFMSVYGTCFKDTTDIEEQKCTDVYKCKGLRSPIFTSCGGDCFPDFIGSHCLSRRLPPIPNITTSPGPPLESLPPIPNITTSPGPPLESLPPIPTRANTTTSSRPPQPTQINRCKMSDPCVNIPFTECVIFKGELKCHCIIGYSMWSHEGCVDMDECELNPCNDDYSVCHNKNGSYECVCKDNLVQISEDICIANSSDDDNLNSYYLMWKRFLTIGMPILSILIMVVIGIFFICFKAPPPTISLETET